MNVLEVVEELIRQDPSKVKTKQQALKHVFLVSGNGLGWNDEGEVASYTNVPLWSEDQEYVSMNDLPEKLQFAVKPVIDKRVKANKRVLQNLESELDGPIESLSGDVFVERGCLAWSMPDNVSSEWKQAFAGLTDEANLVIDE